MIAAVAAAATDGGLAVTSTATRPAVVCSWGGRAEGCTNPWVVVAGWQSYPDQEQNCSAAVAMLMVIASPTSYPDSACMISSLVFLRQARETERACERMGERNGGEVPVSEMPR